MLPDLRFLIGAVLATALLGVTVFGLAAAMHLSRQSKVAPLETSRLLAYTPDGGYRIVDVPARRFDNPFANIPADPNPVPMQQPLRPAPEQELARTPETEDASEPAAQSELAGQPGLAVQPEPTAQPELVAQPELAADTVDAPRMQTAAAAQPESPPADDPDTVDERAVVDPPLPRDGDAPVEAAPSPEPAPAPIAAVPVETVPASAAPVPVVDVPLPPVRPEVEDVGSIRPTIEGAETRSDLPTVEDAGAAAATETPEPKAKRKRAVRRTVARRPPEQSMPINPFGFALYPAPPPASTASTANRPAKGFWPPE